MDIMALKGCDGMLDGPEMTYEELMEWLESELKKFEDADNT